MRSAPDERETAELSAALAPKRSRLEAINEKSWVMNFPDSDRDIDHKDIFIDSYAKRFQKRRVCNK